MPAVFNHSLEAEKGSTVLSGRLGGSADALVLLDSGSGAVGVRAELSVATRVFAHFEYRCARPVTR